MPNSRTFLKQAYLNVFHNLMELSKCTVQLEIRVALSLPELPCIDGNVRFVRFPKLHKIYLR